MKSNNLPMPAKLTAPKVGNVVPRWRLFDLLDAALCKPVAWISAPAGAGKTALVTSYLAARNIKPLWFQIDLRDEEPATFFAYLRQAVAKLSPRRNEMLPLLSPEYALGLPAFVNNFFERMFALLPAGTIVVFDNFQNLPESAQLIELLAQAVSALPEGAAFLFISRADAPAAFARLRAVRQLGYIGPEALLLTGEEARRIGKSLKLAGLSEHSLDQLNLRAGGWVAGLILLLESADIPGTNPEEKVTEHLFDFFAAEIMRREPSEIQHFLVRSALLPVMAPDSTTSLTGNSQSAAILRNLVRRNYFITRLAGTSERYEFHPLFRGYLLETLRQNSDPAFLIDLQQRAGRILAECGEYSSAVELLSRAGAVEDMVSLVLAHAGRQVAEGRFQTLKQWLEFIPEPVREKYPWLLYWQGVSRMPFDLAVARQYFEQAYQAFLSSGDVAGMCLSWSGIVDTIFNLLDSFIHLDPWLDAMDRLIGDFGQPAPPLMVHIAPRMCSALIMRRPQHPELKQWKVLALQAFDADQDLSSKLLGGFYLAATQIWSDDFAAAKEMLMRLRKVGDANAAIPAARIVRELFESWLNWLGGNAVQALQSAETGLAIGQQSGARLWEPLMLIQVIVSEITSGTLPRAEAFLEQLRPMLPHARRWDRAYFYHESGWLTALKGGYAEAMRLQGSALQLIVEISGFFPEAEVRIGMAQALSLNGRNSERDHEWGEARRLASICGSPLLDFSAAFVGTGYALDDGDIQHAGQLARQALGIGNAQGYRNFTWWLPQQAARVCAFALEQGIEAEYVRELIRTRGLVPPGQQHPESWPWPVRIYTLGRFSIVINDKPVELSGKAKTKVNEMLKAIIAFGGHDVAEQHISDLLWPDAEGDSARASFKVTLHRLRKLLGTDVLKLHDGRLTLDERYIWLDIWSFERLLGVLEKSGDDELSALENEVIDRYHGGFMLDEAAAWTLSTRERIRGKYLRVIGQAAERLSLLGQWEAAITCYEKALETEPLAERFYLGLIGAHYQLGQKAEAYLAYRHYRESLERELNIPPSPQIEEWHDKLRTLPP
jgi:LuxR family maltose regulon positive regulatory protein